jgi:hypothetical protein
LVRVPGAPAFPDLTTPLLDLGVYDRLLATGGADA